MASIIGRHIRHDWAEFNDRQDQKSIRAVCGARTRPNLAGIPGVTEQDTFVLTNIRYYGWCAECCENVVTKNTDGLAEGVKPVYNSFVLTVNRVRRERERWGKCIPG